MDFQPACDYLAGVGRGFSCFFEGCEVWLECMYLCCILKISVLCIIYSIHVI